jgi:prepilin-type N-terminal cleavage/methylation domain-containing protein
MARSAIFPVCRREGFSLLELLIVVVILVIITVGIVVVNSNLVHSRAHSRSEWFIQEVRSARETFKGENNGMYPGQDDPGLLKGSPGGKYTGSQMLASRLFGYPYTEIESDAPKAKSLYLTYRADLLISKSSADRSIPKNSLADKSRSPNALLYFPSRLNATAPSECYKWDDNSIYVSKDAAAARREFDKNCSTDPKLNAPNNARNPGGVLIIGTGANNMYLESDDNDDLKSWDVE